MLRSEETRPATTVTPVRMSRKIRDRGYRIVMDPR